ncbi:GyrI-like domain-containing protein [Paraliobacillus sediminis]|uniref:GyrI-like domain-containing protein n=1 Tax=Paraliobacillus sediminis TaxID=1885916 RepID=UPI000E3B7F9C|nr:GyrI-like domain-containing protein [Paraliobacillus sediminis]
MNEHNKSKENSNNTKKTTLENIPNIDHFQASDFPEIVMTPETNYISILGSGAPGTPEFYRKKSFISDLVSTLTYTEHVSDTFPMIEILYWYPEDAPTVDIAKFYSINPISSLHYRIMAKINDQTTMNDIILARRSAGSIADTNNEALELFTLPKQMVIQVMHHGPFANELETLERLGASADHHGVSKSGPHHEIHIDPFTRDTPQDTLRTILRDPVI